ncbi:MAG: light-harvesting antenna LH1, beta subunit [Pseudomonadota bacterium]|nr:light-harvesting antenna LH1, beta subunit [Pseudomonadota bacterium]
MSEESGSMSGLNAKQAQEFHSAFVQGMLGFVGVTLVAHNQIWFWRPWF